MILANGRRSRIVRRVRSALVSSQLARCRDGLELKVQRTEQRLPRGHAQEKEGGAMTLRLCPVSVSPRLSAASKDNDAMVFSVDRLDDHQDGWELPTDLYELRGAYLPMQFAVRMHPNIQAALREMERGNYAGGGVSGEGVLAFGSYFHETIHWWQHVGSSLGLILSLCYPAQTHVNHHILQDLLERLGPVKSLRRYKASATGLDARSEAGLNIVLNNWHDIEYCRRVALIPEVAHDLGREQYFDSIGHGYGVTWAACVAVISINADPTYATLPNVLTWDAPFYDLRNREVEGHHRRSRIVLAATGGRLIFEGQARFCQLQYYHFATDGHVDWNEFRELGMLDDDYVAAFVRFLEFIDEAWPASVDSDAVALFLAICDIAINPGEGFPFDIRRFDTFIEDTDPGIRFLRLCVAARDHKHELLAAAATYSREGYVEIARTLCELFDWRSPVENSERVAAWPTVSREAAEIAAEDETFRFRADDLPVRVFVGRFLSFQRDKQQYPEFFTWPGVFVGGREGGGAARDHAAELFANYEPLFRAQPDGEIRATQIPGRLEADVLEMFSGFYTWTAYYDLVRQWHVSDGPFTYDFRWLNPNHPIDRMERWASNIFQRSFGRSPAEFQIVA
jgi:hypothetical protein